MPDVIADLRQAEKLVREGTHLFFSRKKARHWGQNLPEHFFDNLDRVVHYCEEASEAHGEAWGTPHEEATNLERVAELGSTAAKRRKLPADVVAHAGGEPTQPDLNKTRHVAPFLRGQMYQMAQEAVADLTQWSTQSWGTPV